MTVSFWLYALGQYHIRATISPSLRASVPSRNQETVPPSHHYTLIPATPSHRATCHKHAATVSPWNLVRHRATWCANWCGTVTQPCHLVSHRAIWCATVPPGPPPFHRAAALPTQHISIPIYTDASDSCHHTSWHCLTQFYHMVCW